MLILTKLLFLELHLCIVFTLIPINFLVPYGIRKGYRSMTHGAYGTPITSGAPGILEVNEPRQSSQQAPGYSNEIKDYGIKIKFML